MGDSVLDMTMQSYEKNMVNGVIGFLFIVSCRRSCMIITASHCHRTDIAEYFIVTRVAGENYEAGAGLGFFTLKMRSTIIAMAPSPVTLQAVPKESMAM